MNTPICDFVKNYAESDCLRLHMPGHKGKEILGAEGLDITEIDGADVLYHGDGIIAESQRNATDIFGTAKTVYSTEGSSLSIRAMLYSACIYAKEQGRPLKIAAGRNAHKTFLTASALLGFDIDWLYGDGLLSCPVTAESLEAYLSEAAEKPIAVYITSPDYLGCVTDISSLSEVCKKYSVLLLIDNAHGAYLKFLEEDRHPITLGADACCDSAHKTLPVLTGGGYLHISKNAPGKLVELSDYAMQLFASTSPSYLILQSLDHNNRYLDEEYREILREFIRVIGDLKSTLQSVGFTLVGSEPLKLTIATKSYGYTGDEVAKVLRSKGIVAEFSDPDYICFMLTPENGRSAVEVLKTALCKLPKRAEITETAPMVTVAEKYCSPREALMSLSESKSVTECLGRVMADVSVSCPPAIPVVVCGEIIDRNAIERMRYYGITHCRVIKDK